MKGKWVECCGRERRTRHCPRCGRELPDAHDRLRQKFCNVLWARWLRTEDGRAYATAEIGSGTRAAKASWGREWVASQLREMAAFAEFNDWNVGMPTDRDRRADDAMSEAPCTNTTPGPSTDELRARYHFQAEPLKRLSLGDLADLMVAFAAGEMSGGFLRQITGLDGNAIDFLYNDALARSEELCRSWRESEEVRFRASFASSPSIPTDTESSSSTPAENS